MWEFDSLIPNHRSSQVAADFFSGCSAVGSALGSGPRGRGFESRHSDHKKLFHRLVKELFVFHGVTGFEQPAPATAGHKQSAEKLSARQPAKPLTHLFKDFPPPFYKNLPRAFSALGSEVFISPSISFHPDFIWVCLIQSFQSESYTQALLPNHCQRFF